MPAPPATPSGAAPLSFAEKLLTITVLVLVVTLCSGAVGVLAAAHGSVTRTVAATVRASAADPSNPPPPSPAAPSTGVYQAIDPVESLPNGSAVAGGSAARLAWHVIAPLADGSSVDVVPNGVAFHLPGGNDSSLPVPVTRYRYAIRTDADITLTSGPEKNQLGIGCYTPSDAVHYGFFISGGGVYRVEDMSTSVDVLAEGHDAAIRSLAEGNHLSAVCATAEDGSVHRMFAVNGTVLVDGAIAAGTVETGWAPDMELCSCYGTDVATYLNVTEFDLTRPPTAAPPSQ